MTLHPPIVAPFAHSDTVTITIYDLSDNSVVVNAAACAEIGSTGYFKYVPALSINSKSYLFVVTNGTVAMDRIGELPPITPGSLASGDVSGNLPCEVKAQDNIDFGALQKASLNAATPASVQNIAANGSGFTALGDARLVNLDSAVSTRLAGASYTTPPTASAIDSVLTAAHGAGDWTTEKTGSSTYTDTITDGTDPIEGVQVELYSDSGYSTLVAVEETDINGSFTFNVNPATYYVRCVKSGYTFTDFSKVVT
jgi:hypothetical protein